MTQLQIIARHILKYGHITRNEAIGLYGITRLAARILEMKNAGVPVISHTCINCDRKDYLYTYRTDFLERIRALHQAQELMERHGWKKAA